MEKRNTLARRRAILAHLEDKSEATVELLANLFETSEVTIRKDLGELETTGLVIRRHGGAILRPKDQVTDSLVESPSPEKQAIALAASSLIRDHNRLVIDSGQTTSTLLPMLSGFLGLVVMTNSLTVAQKLRALEKEPTILMTGGTWDRHSESFQGQSAEAMLREYDFDQLFIGADGLDPERGTTTYNELTGLSKTMAAVSREVIVLAESNKADRKIPNLELAWSEVDVLVTDAKLNKRVQMQIESLGVRVIIAELEA